MRVENLHLLPDLLHDACSQNRPPVKGEIHVTQLISPPMIDHLRRLYWDELVDDSSKRLFALFGQGMHAAIANDGRIEHAKKVLGQVINDWYSLHSEVQLCIIKDLLGYLNEHGQTGIESHLKVKLKGGVWTLVGTDDHYDELQAKLMDWKTTSVWSIVYGGHNWEEQLNMYGWMRRKMGFPVKQLVVWALIRDWQKSKAKYNKDPNYPKIPFYKAEFPVWSMKKCEEYIYGKLIEFNDSPRPCTPSERWQVPTCYKVMKKGRKSAVIATVWRGGEKRSLLSVAEAVEAARTFKKPINVDGTQHYIQKFQGECKRCEDYCLVSGFCEQYKEMLDAAKGK